MTASQSSSPTLIDRLGRIPSKVARTIRKQIYKPTLNVSAHAYRLLRLGSKYGGWSFVDTPALRNSTVVSCGLGEDASFDVEFAARYGCRVLLVDPTPKAITHFHQIAAKFGSTSTAAYTDGGKQPIEAYDLSKLGPQNLQLVDKALWIESTTLKFYTPRDPTHVSHSIVNFQNDYRQDSDHIEVEAVTLNSLMSTFDLRNLPLIKLDIEGAEIEVLNNMMEARIFPQQILVEYDELSKPSKISKDRIDAGHASLLKNGYELIHFESPSNFLYVKDIAK